ncbi:hypothetical protein GCM10022216_14480 [Sphingobacterium kyonggiense]|uniref:Uncharacterized protein n=1 Tax=Sphingobacterium kyonggiense TaxID=714075 RepID=A0ABP7YL63_9SPHI
MEKAILNNNIVILGNFKPATFDKLFMIKSGLVEDGEFLDESIFSPDYALIVTEKLLFEIEKNKVSLNFKDDKLIKEGEKITKIFKNSDIKAFGFNFKRALILDDFNQYKKFFYFENNVLNKHFDGNETTYGYYVSKDFEDYRLSLNIKPLKLQKIEEEEEEMDALDFNFNFHFSKGDLIKELSNALKYENITVGILNDYERNY